MSKTALQITKYFVSSTAGRCLIALLVLAVYGASTTCRAQTSTAGPTNGAAADLSETRTYALRYVDAQTARKMVLSQLEGTQPQVIADHTARRLLVHTEPEGHQKIQQLLAQIDAPPPVPSEPANGVNAGSQSRPPFNQARPQAANQVAEKAEGSFRLRNLTAETLHERLEKVLEKQLPVRRDASGHWLSFAVRSGTGPHVAVSVHDLSGHVQIAGLPNQVRAWQQIIQTIDSPPASDSDSGQTVTQLVSASTASPTQIRTAVDVLNSQTQTSGQPTDQPDGASPEPPHSAQQSEAKPLEKLNSLLGPVQIEFIEGTDILVLRGNPHDVQRVMAVIHEIEQLSRVSEPLIEVCELEHVDSEAFAPLLSQLFNDSPLSALYGRLLVVPLVKPNAVLIVGMPTTVRKSFELIEKLDQPGKALTQYEVFRLKHTTAANAQEVVENLFPSGAEAATPTLGPRALVVADGRTNTLIVRAAPRDMLEVRQLVNEIDRPGSEAVNEIRVIRLKHSIASDLAPVIESALEQDGNDADNQILSPLLQLVTIDAEGKQKLESGVLAGASVSADSRANALIVSAPADGMPLLESLITQLDQPPDASAELKVFTIANGDAVSLADMLQELFGDTQQQGGGGGNNDEEIFNLRVSVDERTNSIIAAGTSADLLVVEAVLLRLDSDDVRKRQNRVYRLKNASAEGVAEALTQWMEAERNVQETAPGTTSPFEQIEREVVVVPDLNSNSLIISATPRFYNEVVHIVQQLDEQAPMVMIQVLIGEVKLGDADEFGVELGLQDSVLFDRSLLEDLETTTSTTTVPSSGGATTLTQQVIQSATLTPGFDFNNPSGGLGNSGSDRSLASAGHAAAQGLSSFALQRVSPDLGFSGLVLSASSDSISMLLRALQESRRLEVLSRPQIMALDNQEGRAFVGEQVPFITRSDIDQIGQRSNTIEFRDVGLDLVVTPRISPDGLVVMYVYAQKSELGPVSEGVPISIAPNGDAINAPRIAITLAETTVSAVSGQTVVLSGLLTKRDRAIHRRVPLLADVPLLGDLFRYDSVQTERSELLIILTPHVVRNRFEAEMIKQVESARMSWCLADAIDLHGAVGLRSRDDPLGETEAQIVYPEHVPQQEMMPEISPEPGEVEMLPSAIPSSARRPSQPAEPRLAKVVPTSANTEPVETQQKPSEESKGFSLLRLFDKKSDK